MSSSGVGADAAAGGDGFLASLSALRQSIRGSYGDGSASATATSTNTTQATASPERGPRQSALEAETIRLRSDLATSRAALAKTLSSHEDVVRTLRSQINESKSDATAARSMQTAAEVRLEACTKRADEMQAQLSGATGLRRALEQRVSSLEGELSTVRSDTGQED